MTDQYQPGSDDKLVTRDVLLEIIKQETGLVIRPGTMNQICGPARNEGPEVAGYLGRRPVYSAKKGVAWVLSRLRPKPYTVHPVRQGS